MKKMFLLTALFLLSTAQIFAQIASDAVYIRPNTSVRHMDAFVFVDNRVQIWSIRRTVSGEDFCYQLDGYVATLYYRINEECLELSFSLEFDPDRVSSYPILSLSEEELILDMRGLSILNRYNYIRIPNISSKVICSITFENHESVFTYTVID